jgi:hypothetical protein
MKKKKKIKIRRDLCRIFFSPGAEIPLFEKK